jgi:hypothetical protein
MPDLRVSFPKPCDEAWEGMTPSGCDRVCARCDHVVHDLREYTLDEAEALLRVNPGSCVRAQIGADGAVALKLARGSKARRMVIAAAATAGLLATTAPAYARQERPGGAISGNVYSNAPRLRITARDASGRAFRTRTQPNGDFRIRHLPAGTYRLTFVSSCGEERVVENVVVAAGETVVPRERTSGDECIVVGLLRIENDRG